MTTTAAQIAEAIAALRATQKTQTGTPAWDTTQAEIVKLEDLAYDLAGSHTWNTSKCQ